MKVTFYSGWLMIGVGVALLAGGIAAGSPLFGVLMLAALGGSGLLMVWLGKGWDKPLDSAADLYKYGRPANAVVKKVEDATLDASGIRTAKLTVRVSPVNESSYNATQRVALPGGRVPDVGDPLTVKFDPHSRRSFVVLDESYQVKDSITQSREQLAAASQMLGDVQPPPRS
jgi:hypothetical protein